ncbi:hypothetical protein T484DRAFT_1971368 [Baffinella frigidus]|nr:hypothetical protein T484DRAFT_1971368 [Cryptophyta sp. CCMP2293]
MAALVSFASWLDTRYPIGAYMMAIKAYVFAFPVGLLDLHFSETRGVPLGVLAGAGLWCSTLLLRQAVVDGGWPNGGAGLPPLIVHELTLRAALVEVPRYVGMLVLTGLLSDLLFSPLHRFMYRPGIYKELGHKKHHGFTTELTALALYHGTLLDDFLMPFTTFIGGVLCVGLLSLAGLEASVFSNVSGYLVVCNTLMSHAHDVRCARLMAPLPDSLNFVAYHRVHHLHPSRNFGLTEPSDLLWDFILGVRTILKPEGLDPAAGPGTIR